MTNNSDKPLLVDTGRGFSVKWRNRFLYSSRDPRASVARRVSSFVLEPDTLYLIPSPLLGYGMEELQKSLPPRSFLLGVERFQDLMALTQPHLSPVLTGGVNCAIIRTEYARAAGDYVSDLGLSRFKRCRRLDLTGGSRLDPDFYRSLEEELNRRIFSYWQTKASLVKMGPLWFRNIFRNIPQVAPGRDISSLSVQGTLVLCGAGESLEKSLPLLKRMRKNIFLCCVDTAYPVLTGYGLMPDCVFNLDGQFYNFYDYYHHRNHSLYLISDITAFPESLRLPGVEPLFFSSRFAENDLLSRLEIGGILPSSIAPMGSVGVTALYLCTLIGRGPLILTGLDFSYQTGKSHARDTVYHQLYLSRTNRMLPDGGMTDLSLRRPAHSVQGELTGRKLRSDTVLDGYYRTFLELTALHRERCFRPSHDYPSLGVPLLEDEEMINLGERTGMPEITRGKSDINNSEWISFLQKEIELLESVISAWDIYTWENRTDALEKALSRCDYLTLTVGTESSERGSVYYTQTVKNARQYLSYAKHSLSCLSQEVRFNEKADCPDLG